MSSQCEALVTKVQDGKSILVKDSVPIPPIGDNQVLVKVLYVAQNPLDVQTLDASAFGDGAVLGCDFVGTVEKVGSKVTRVALNDTIAGLIWGGEIPGLGGYSQYTVADEAICFPVPSGIPFEAAATVPLAFTTAVLALFSKDCLAIDRSSKSSVLIWGGSSSVGLLAIQIAAIYGLDIIVTCSPRYYDLVRSLGASHVFNYRDADVAQQIARVCPDLRYVFDTIGSPGTSVAASQALSSGGSGTLCTVRPGKTFTEGVKEGTKVTDVMVWSCFLKDHQVYGTLFWPASEPDHNLSAEFFNHVGEWIVQGKIKPNTVKLFENGLDDVTKGFQEYHDGKVSGYKIVYKL